MKIHKLKMIVILSVTIAILATIPILASGLNNEQTLHAKWKPHDYDIKYNLDGGTATNPVKYNIESNKITLNNPTKADYVFTGWSGTGLTGSTNMTVVISTGSKGDREYTAHWRIDSDPVTLQLKGTTSKITKVECYPDSGTDTTQFTSSGYSNITCYTNRKVILHHASSTEWKYKDLSGTVHSLGIGTQCSFKVPRGVTGTAQLYVGSDGCIEFSNSQTTGYIKTADCYPVYCDLKGEPLTFRIVDNNSDYRAFRENIKEIRLKRGSNITTFTSEYWPNEIIQCQPGDRLIFTSAEYGPWSSTYLQWGFDNPDDPPFYNSLGYPQGVFSVCIDVPANATESATLGVFCSTQFNIIRYCYNTTTGWAKTNDLKVIPCDKNGVNLPITLTLTDGIDDGGFDPNLLKVVVKRGSSVVATYNNNGNGITSPISCQVGDKIVFYHDSNTVWNYGGRGNNYNHDKLGRGQTCSFTVPNGAVGPAVIETYINRQVHYLVYSSQVGGNGWTEIYECYPSLGS